MDGAEVTIARDGHLLRHVSKGDDDVASVGEELACESSFETLRLVDDTGNTYYEELMIDPYKVAAAHSIDPTALGRDTPQVGRGVLATTAYGREHGLPIRALRISEPESD